MTVQEMLSHVDHTQLKPVATWEDIETLCKQAISFHTASVCIPSCYVKRVRETFGEAITICTVVGFPLGYCNTQGKLAETRQALEEGCDEIDMVINLCHVKNGAYDQVEAEIRALKEVCGNHILKVIIETCYLTEEEKIRLCQVVTSAGADYIKTSTGFGTGGATLEDVKLMKANIGPKVKIKAAGGVSSIQDMEQFLQEGCDRIGTSRAVGLCQGSETSGY